MGYWGLLDDLILFIYDFICGIIEKRRCKMAYRESKRKRVKVARKTMARTKKINTTLVSRGGRVL